MQAALRCPAWDDALTLSPKHLRGGGALLPQGRVLPGRGAAGFAAQTPTESLGQDSEEPVLACSGSSCWTGDSHDSSERLGSFPRGEQCPFGFLGLATRFPPKSLFPLTLLSKVNQPSLDAKRETLRLPNAAPRKSYQQRRAEVRSPKVSRRHPAVPPVLPEPSGAAAGCALPARDRTLLPQPRVSKKRIVRKKPNKTLPFPSRGSPRGAGRPRAAGPVPGGAGRVRRGAPGYLHPPPQPRGTRLPAHPPPGRPATCTPPPRGTSALGGRTPGPRRAPPAGPVPSAGSAAARSGCGGGGRWVAAGGPLPHC